MRAKSKYFLQSREGEERVVRKFLLWPRCFAGNKEWRWLEWALITEKVCQVDVGGTCEWGDYAWCWCEVGFANTTSGNRKFDFVASSQEQI